MKTLLPNGIPVSQQSNELVEDGNMGLETLMSDSVPTQSYSSQIPWEHEDASIMLIDYTYD